jgi:DNA repair exonuclease SbcCD ATPase subunit
VKRCRRCPNCGSEHLGGFSTKPPGNEVIICFYCGISHTTHQQAALEAAQNRIEELKRETACPCCTNGITIEGEPCEECRGKGSVSIAYENCRVQYKLLQRENSDLRERLQTIQSCADETYQEYFDPWHGGDKNPCDLIQDLSAKVMEFKNKLAEAKERNSDLKNRIEELERDLTKSHEDYKTQVNEICRLGDELEKAVATLKLEEKN